MTTQSPLPASVKAYLGSIGSRGGKAGTGASKVRPMSKERGLALAASGLAARRKKQASGGSPDSPK